MAWMEVTKGQYNDDPEQTFEIMVGLKFKVLIVYLEKI